MSERPIRILIADDHPVFRFGLRALLEAQTDMVVVGEAESGAEAIQLVQSLWPDVLLMDINMPGINGIEATKQITAMAAPAATDPHPAVLILTMFDDDTVLTAMRAGARGYVLKGAQGDETLRAIRAVANGEVIFSPGVAGRMMSFIARGSQEPAADPFPELTLREREILELLAQGLTNSTIAERLVLSPKTVRNQVSNIFSKLQVSGRGEAIIKAREAGLGSSPP